MENSFKIHKEEMELFVECISNILEDEKTFHKIINSNKISMEYIKCINKLAKKNRNYLSESGWKYIKQVLEIVNRYDQGQINISEILKLEGFPDFFWDKLFEYLGYDTNLDIISHMEEDLTEIDQIIPLIKIDTKTNQIYLSINLNKFQLPNLFSKHLVQSFPGEPSRVYFNQIYDFEATYSSKKSNDKDNNILEIEGINLKKLPIYFKENSKVLISENKIETGRYYCIQDKESMDNIEEDLIVGEFSIAGINYLVNNKYIEKTEVIENQSEIDIVISEEIPDDQNLIKAWKMYKEKDYTNAINSLGNILTQEDQAINNSKSNLINLIYFKTLRISTLYERLSNINSNEKLTDINTIIYSYCLLILKKDNEINIKSINNIITASYLIEEDRLFFINLIDILNNKDDIEYLMKYKDTEDYFEMLILYRIFNKNNKENNIYENKLKEVIFEIPSSTEIKELINELE